MQESSDVFNSRIRKRNSYFATVCTGPRRTFVSQHGKLQVYLSSSSIICSIHVLLLGESIEYDVTDRYAGDVRKMRYYILVEKPWHVAS